MGNPTTMSLSDIMMAVRQRADMFPSGYTPTTTGGDYFVTDPELISYINQSYFELYDLLVGTYEEYYVAPPLVFQTDGSSSQYNLPDGTLYSAAPALYKLLGVDLGVANNSNAWVTLKKFEFISRNRYVLPQVNSNYLGVFNLRYRLVGNTLMFIPSPASGQFIRLWYIPKLTPLSLLTDTADGVSGWTEYIIVDAAKKCASKEESFALVNSLSADKAGLIKRIEEMGMNRDAGQPDTISDTRTQSERWGAPNGDGSYGGY